MLIDLTESTSGSVHLTGSLAVHYAVPGSVSGSGNPSDVLSVLNLVQATVSGTSTVSGAIELIIGFSGVASGSGGPSDGLTVDAVGTASGTSTVSAGTLVQIYSLVGIVSGQGTVALSVPEPAVGVAIVSGFMEVLCIPPPICETPQVQKYFRWGHQFVPGDLTIQVTGQMGNPLGPVCIRYTLYQVERGCAPIQRGPSGRHPGNAGVGSYYATGFAGECGQPGLWLIRWSYQKTFGDSFQERDCYFYVVDSVLCPVPGDTLPRNCKYGWT
jgi:hypothetical protein